MHRRSQASPLERAQATLYHVQSEGRSKIPRSAISTSRRIIALTDRVRRELDAAKAPYRVVRWVAWGQGRTAQQQRVALALHLSRTLDTACGGWPDDRALAAAWELWQSTIAAARRQGRRPPRCGAVPSARYAAAIASATRSARRAPSNATRKEPLVLTAEQRAEFERLLQALPVLRTLLGALHKLGLHHVALSMT